MTLRTIFISPRTGRVRAAWRVTVFFLLLIIAFGVLGFAAGFIFMVVTRTLPTDQALRERLGTPGFEVTLYILQIAAAVIASALSLRWFDQRRLGSIGYRRHRGWWRDFVLGLIVASGMISLIVLVQVVSGTLALRLSEEVIARLRHGVWSSALIFLVAACFEELVFRGYPLQTLLKDFRPLTAMGVPSVIFGLAHFLNPSWSWLALINTVLAGVWLSVGYYKTRSLWFVTGEHFAWNFTMGTIYGLNVSGLQDAARTALFTALPRGPEWVTGGDYGPEGGILASFILVGATLWLWRASWLGPAPESLADLEPSSPPAHPSAHQTIS
jgi:membrane protease YdiL (CAAX protease family)